VGGTVANLAVKKGDIVNPALPLMSLFREDSLLVEAYVPAGDVQGIYAGMKVALLRDRKDKGNIIEGTVKRIAPTAVEKISALGLVEQRVKVLIEPDISEIPALFPGYKLDVEFAVDRRENKLVVPKTVLFPYGEGKALWVVRGGKAAVQPVETGFENDREVAIEKGLESGDLVILNPRVKGLKEGKKIIRSG